MAAYIFYPKAINNAFFLKKLLNKKLLVLFRDGTVYVYKVYV